MAFCPSCGKEVSLQAVYCPNCGHALSQQAWPAAAAQPTESVSALYWLLPFFFALLGGIVAYLVVKDRNRRMANQLLIFGLVWTVVGVVFSIIVFAFVTGLIGGLTASTTYTYTSIYTSVSP